MGKFSINNNTRVIAKKEGLLLVTNNQTANLNDLFELAVIINDNGEILSPVLPICVLTKNDNWEWEDYKFYEKEDILDNLI